MGNGRKGKAPCGHDGEAVVGQYYECLEGCQGLKPPDDQEITLEMIRCNDCGSWDVDGDFELDPLYYFFNPGTQPLNTRCNDCGKCWTR